jgi:hypothetical protein
LGAVKTAPIFFNQNLNQWWSENLYHLAKNQLNTEGNMRNALVGCHSGACHNGSLSYKIYYYFID